MKRRARSNRIGARGEAAFRLFASDHGLVPARPDEEVGLDFICQVDEAPASATSGVSGVVLGACVRSTSSTDARIRLNRDDATMLLRAEFPICVVLVHVVGADERFFHRFVDVEFAKELIDFVESGRRTYSLIPSHCNGEAGFRHDVEQLLQPASVEQRRIALAERLLGRVVSDVTIEIRRRAEGQLTLVSAFNFFEYLDRLEESDRRRVYAATFGAPARQQDRLRDLALRQDLLAGLGGLPQPYVLRGFTIADPAGLLVTDEDGQAQCDFSYTSNGAHSGYVHHQGFALTISDRKLKDGIWVHELVAFADPEVNLELPSTPDLFAFLERCVPGASIRTPEPASGEFKVEDFGDLPHFGRFAGYLRHAARLAGWTPEIASLRDALDPETLDTMAWLSALARHPDDVVTLAFVLFEENLTAFLEERGRWRVPVVANTVNASVIAWLQCEGRLLTRNGSIAGFRTDKVVDISLNLHERIEKRRTDPEFVIDRSSSVVFGHGSEGYYRSPSRAEGWPCECVLE